MVMSDTETHADRARIANALTAAYEFKACATAFGVRKEVEASGIPLLTEYKGHQSLRERLIQGYQVVTF